MPLIRRVLPLSVIVVVCAGVGACVPPPGGGGFYGSEGPRQVYVPVRRDDDRRFDDRRYGDGRYDERRYDERRDDRRRDEAVGRQREQDNASRQQQYNSHVRDIQTQHNQRITSLQQQFNQGRLSRGQLDAGYRDAERDLNRRIGDEQRALPR